MLRACRRVLKRAGRLVFFAVVVAGGIDDATLRRVEAGIPTFAPTGQPYGDLLHRAGFTSIIEQDVTDEYIATARRWMRESTALAAPLRAAVGDEVFEEKQETRRQGLAALEAGALGRMRYSAVAG